MRVQANPAEIPAFLTLSGACREVNTCAATLKRRIAAGEVAPDAVLVESQGRPGSLLFKAENLPAIAAALANKPK